MPRPGNMAPSITALASRSTRMQEPSLAATMSAASLSDEDIFSNPHHELGRSFSSSEATDSSSDAGENSGEPCGKQSADELRQGSGDVTPTRSWTSYSMPVFRVCAEC